MKISQVSNQNYKPHFGLKIDAPEDFWDTKNHPNSSPEIVAKFNDSFELLQRIESDKTLILRMDRVPDGWDWDSIYTSTVQSGKSSYIKIKELKNRGWLDLVIQTAKKLRLLKN